MYNKKIMEYTNVILTLITRQMVKRGEGEQ